MDVVAEPLALAEFFELPYELIELVEGNGLPTSSTSVRAGSRRATAEGRPARTPPGGRCTALHALVVETQGQSVLMNAAAGPHQLAVSRLLVLLVAACPPGYEAVPSPIDWVLWGDPRATVRQPDLAVVRTEQLRGLRLTEPPLLAVEVVSASSAERDLVAKQRDYARAGCPHYWIVVPEQAEIVRLRLDGDAYVEAGRIRADDGPMLVDEPFPVTVDTARLRL